ncbi:MAG: hypothetical protein HY582_05110 [Candidatus Omnitrophica bacterium]|nr:hypothetical protein [Candidatus Omnitrophota bacterium]
MPQMKVFIFHSTAGEGHKKIGEAIADELKSRSLDFDVRAFDALEWASPLFKKNYATFYFYMVKYIPQFWGFLYETSDRKVVSKFLKPLRARWNQLQSKALRTFVEREKPDVIIATHFYAAQVFGTAKKKSEINSKLITVITDVMPHAFWVNEGTDQYWVMAEESKQELIRRNVLGNQIFVGGIPVGKEFVKKENCAELIAKFGLQPDRTTILFSSGSFGVGPTKDWLHELESFGSKIQVIVICGRNQELFHQLSSDKYTFPIVLTGFVTNMHEYMSVSDLLVAKSGGSTTSESLAKELPMLISAPIPGQETRNATWLLKKQASFQIKRPGDLKQAVQWFIEDPSRFQAAKEKIRTIAKPNAASDLVNHLLSGKS